MTDEMRAAVLLKCISGPLKVHLNLALNESASYSKIREMIQAYDTAITKWSDSPAVLQPQALGDAGGVAPMEIDRVKGGKQGGKGKTKGKDGKGKPKGKDLKGKGKGQNLQGQWNSSSATTWTSTSKSSGKGDQKEVWYRQVQGQVKGQGCRCVLQLWPSRPSCQRLLESEADWQS